MPVRQTGGKEKFLMWMLASVFAFQAGVFTFAVVKCSKFDANKVQGACPDLGRRYDQTFGVMIATILALLGASGANNGSKP